MGPPGPPAELRSMPTVASEFEIFLVSPPGLEAVLCDEVSAKGFIDPKAVTGGVVVRGGWPEVWRANLEIRGATRVLARIGAFHAGHLAQLDKLARKFPWGENLASRCAGQSRGHQQKVPHLPCGCGGAAD